MKHESQLKLSSEQPDDTDKAANVFYLRVKKDKVYADRMVIIDDKEIRYYKKEEPDKVRFSAKLMDIIFFEKHVNDKSNYKVVITSKTNSFPMVKIKDKTSSNFSNLLLFKSQLEDRINKVKMNKYKSVIIMRINKAQKEGLKIIQGIGNNSTLGTKNSKSDFEPSRINVSTECLRRFFNKNISNSKSTYQIDTKKYDQLFKYDYNMFKTESDVEHFTTDNYTFSRKIYVLTGKAKQSRFDEVSKQIEDSFTNAKNIHLFFNGILTMLFFVFIVYNIYYHNYFQIGFTLLIYTFLKFQYIDNFQISKALKDNTFSLDLFLNPWRNADKFKTVYLKSTTNVNLNILTVQNLLVNLNNYNKWNRNTQLSSKADGKFDVAFYGPNNENEMMTLQDVEFQYYHNSSENKLIVAEIYRNDLKNLYYLGTNDDLTKTYITFFSLVNTQNPGFYFKFCLNKLKHFVNFIKFESKSEVYFGNETTDLDFDRINILLKEIEADSQGHNQDDNQDNNQVNQLDTTINLDQTLQYEYQQSLRASMVSASMSYFIRPDHKFILDLKDYINKIPADLETNCLKSDQYIIDILNNLNYTEIKDKKENRTSYSSYTSALPSNLEFVKQQGVKNGKVKVYKSKIKIDVGSKFVVEYLKNFENRLKFNKFLKDIVILKESPQMKIQYQVYDFKMFKKRKDFILVERTSEIKLDKRMMTVISANSLFSKENDQTAEIKFENTDRAYIFSSGYYIEDLNSPNVCKLGFWIECDMSSDETLQDHVIKDYLNHIKSIRDNILFDISK